VTEKDKRLAAWADFKHTNLHKHDCRGHCPRCDHEDAAERAAIQTEGQDRSAFERAIELLKAKRRPGQRQLSV